MQLKFTKKLKGLSSRQRATFATVCIAGFFNNYDGALLSLAIEQIQRGLKISEASLSRMASLITLGSLLAPLITSQADRRGRRKLLIASIAMFSLLSGLTAFAWDARSFVALKFLTVAFSAAEGSIAMVMLVEEVNADARGLAVGLLGAISAGGFGLAALGFAMIGVFPYGWRGLFAIAFIPLLLIVPLLRLLPESSRYESTTKAMTPGGYLDPFRALFSSYPGRFIMVAAVMFLNAMGGTPAGLLQAKYLQEIRGWTPANVSTLIFTGGTIGILGNIVAGNLSDQIGRRFLGAAMLFAAPAMWMVFFNSAGDLMIASWVMSLFAQTAASTIINAYSAELFPTSHRSTAESAIAVAGTLGGSAGLILESWIYVTVGNHWRAVSLLMLASFAAAITVAIFFPETASAELDTISPERSRLSRGYRRRIQKKKPA
ncbi:MAG TPA: MFS transporter [Candidatus Binataceae bacterium]|nr:MFS transporter [Candidatus Binataceae bacterium]